MKVKEIIEKIEEHKRSLKKEKEKLENSIGELENLLDKCTEAYYSLETTVDLLREVV